MASSPYLLIPPIAFGMPGWMEIGVILLIVLLLFGHRLPRMARDLGRSFMEFRKGIKGSDDAPQLPPSDEKSPVARKEREEQRT